MRVSRFVLYPAVACALASAFAVAAPAFAQTTDSTAAKTTINDDQFGRGATVFNKVCLECHTKTDMTGADFKVKWNTRPVLDLFEVIRTTMPDNAPGTMSRDQYIDVTAYLLRLNGAPGGGMPIVQDDTASMHKLKIEITVPAPPIDSIKVDTTKAKVDTLAIRSMLHQFPREFPRRR